MMKVNKRGERHISLKDADVIGLVETLAEAKHVPLFEAAEMLILNTASNAPAEAHEAHEVILDSCGYGSFVDVLIDNGYTVKITPTADNTVLNGKVIISFERK